MQGEKLVETSLEQARKKAAAEADKIISDANAKAKTVSFKVDPKTMKKIIGILQKVVD
jgi:vacuolar-type H+-ATPase subunit H